jgi:predicted nucleotidyltransferase
MCIMQKLHNICDLSEEYIQKVKLALSSHVEFPNLRGSSK